MAFSRPLWTARWCSKPRIDQLRDLDQSIIQGPLSGVANRLVGGLPYPKKPPKPHQAWAETPSPSRLEKEDAREQAAPVHRRVSGGPPRPGGEAWAARRFRGRVFQPGLLPGHGSTTSFHRCGLPAARGVDQPRLAGVAFRRVITLTTWKNLHIRINMAFSSSCPTRGLRPRPNPPAAAGRWAHLGQPHRRFGNGWAWPARSARTQPERSGDRG